MQNLDFDHPSAFWLDLYVNAKLALRVGRFSKNLELAKSIVQSNNIKTPKEAADYIATNFKYKSDPLWGLIDIQYDLYPFIKNKGGDCEDFALAVCRLWQALGLKSCYVTLVSANIFDNHVMSMCVYDGMLYYATPYAFVQQSFLSVKDVIKHFETFSNRDYILCDIDDVANI